MKSPVFYVKGLAKLAIALPLYVISYLVPRSSKRMAIGAWQGKLYCDNPKYFMLYVLKHKDIKVTWIGEKCVEELLPKHPNLTFAVKDSPKAIWALLRAKTWIYCWGLFFDLTDVPIRGRALVINLWHGIPVKYVGRNTFNGRTQSFKGSLISELYLRVLHSGGQLSYLTTSSDRMTALLADGVPAVFSDKLVIKSGSPRNDFLINNASNVDLINALKEKYAKLLCFDHSKKIVTYLPTHRNDGQYTFAFFDANEEDQRNVKQLLDDNNAILLEKHHFLTLQNFPRVKPSCCAISISAEQQQKVDVQELLLITDVLISDYSGAYIDYALLKRPTIHFAYDYFHYLNDDSGMAYPLERYAAGPVVQKMDELLVKLSNALVSPTFMPAESCHAMVAYENGTACEKICQFVTKNSIGSAI